jgi:hypothetical protein
MLLTGVEKSGDAQPVAKLIQVPVVGQKCRSQLDVMLVGTRRRTATDPRAPDAMHADLSALDTSPLAQGRHTLPSAENVPRAQRAQTESEVKPNPGMLQRQMPTWMGKFRVAAVPIPSAVPTVPEPTSVVATPPGEVTCRTLYAL